LSPFLQAVKRHLCFSSDPSPMANNPPSFAFPLLGAFLQLSGCVTISNVAPFFGHSYFSEETGVPQQSLPMSPSGRSFAAPSCWSSFLPFFSSSPPRLPLEARRASLPPTLFVVSAFFLAHTLPESLLPQSAFRFSSHKPIFSNGLEPKRLRDSSTILPPDPVSAGGPIEGPFPLLAAQPGPRTTSLLCTSYVLLRLCLGFLFGRAFSRSAPFRSTACVFPSQPWVFHLKA